MRHEAKQHSDPRTHNEERQLERAAVRQLERAEIYLAAVAYMELGDAVAQRTLNQIRTDISSLRRHLAEQPSASRS